VCILSFPVIVWSLVVLCSLRHRNQTRSIVHVCTYSYVFNVVRNRKHLKFVLEKFVNTLLLNSENSLLPRAQFWRRFCGCSRRAREVWRSSLRNSSQTAPRRNIRTANSLFTFFVTGARTRSSPDRYGGYNYDSTLIRQAFDCLSKVIRSQWRNTLAAVTRWPISLTYAAVHELTTGTPTEWCRSSNGRSAVDLQSHGSRTAVESQSNRSCKHCLITLRDTCGAVYCNRSCMYVGLFVCGSVTMIIRNCVHRSSPNWVCM